MNVKIKLVMVAVTIVGALTLYLVFTNGTASGAWQSGMPVRCRVWINTDLTDQNVPMTCTTPDGNEYVKRRLTSQPTVAASVRIWEENGLSETGCDTDSVIGSFVTDQYITLADASITGQEHIAYNTPYLVLTPNDCLAVYTSTTSGLVVELSGYQWTSLGIPVSNAFLPSVYTGN
jgi:hypothetical protein